MEVLIFGLLAAAVYVVVMPLYALREARRASAQADSNGRELDLLRHIVDELQTQMRQLKADRAHTAAPRAAAVADAVDAAAAAGADAGVTTGAAADLDTAAPAHAPVQPSAPLKTAANAHRRKAEQAPSPAPAAPAAPARPLPPVPPQWLAIARDWLFGGNVVAKLGLLILFMGVSFLLKYASTHFNTPIELRMAGIVLADLSLLAWGWRIRSSRPGISLPVQGTALAVLILTTFAAFRIYHLLPAGPAFGLLTILVAFTCLLAVLQNAVWLAVFGIIGGFAAPVLVSTGSGNHIALFSYCAVLNAGILYIAAKTSWRVLNVLGFLCTFMLATSWGVLRYTPDNYLSAQLFLALFLLMYIAIAIFHARQEAPKLAHYVDGTLVFGTPLAAMGLQYGLVQHMEFGMAYSALAMGLLYAGLALTLWRRMGTTFRLLAESFLALGVVFGTLALPFALDGRWTATAWALEGAGVVWAGLRQQRKLAWTFGLLVQACAWISFLTAVSGLDPQTTANTNLWLGFLILAVTAFAMAVQLRGAGDTVPAALRGTFATALLASAAAWLLAGAWNEIFSRTGNATQINLLTVSALVVAALLGVIAARLKWRIAASYAVAVQLLAGGVFLYRTRWDWTHTPVALFDGPFLSASMLGAGLFLSSLLFKRYAVQYAALRSDFDDTNSLELTSGALLPGVGLAWYGMALAPFAAWLGDLYASRFKVQALDLPPAAAFYIIAASLLATLMLHLAKRFNWTRLCTLSAPVWLAQAAASAGMLGLLYGACSTPGPLWWCAYATAWAASEYALRFWNRMAWPLQRTPLMALHLLRIAVPWLMIWPVLNHAVAHWLAAGSTQEQIQYAMAGMDASGGWARYLPAWSMMGASAWLLRRSADDAWPLHPLTAWHRRVLIPLITAWPLLLAALWNLRYNGTMAPLPYIPLLNPLDLTTGFALLLAAAAFRQHRLAALLKLLACGAAYVWFNLILLRSVANYMDIAYRFDALMASQFVQAMLSLVWSVSALVLMRLAAQRGWRLQWSMGAALLALVVLKLFAVDLSNAGGIERIVSFIGAGLLMVAIGYVAPLPARTGMAQ